MPEHIDLDMIPALIDSTHLQEWVDLCEEFVARRPEWKTKILTSLLACTLHSPGLYRLFREKTKDEEFNDWPEVWQTMRSADIESKNNYVTENGVLLAGGHLTAATIAGGNGTSTGGISPAGNGSGPGGRIGGVGPIGTGVFGSGAARYMPYPKVEGMESGGKLDKKVYICDECSREFRRPEHLKRHYRSIHTNEKPFECVYCQKRFSRSDNLAQHERSHARKKRMPAFDDNEPEAHRSSAHSRHNVSVHSAHSDRSSHASHNPHNPGVNVDVGDVTSVSNGTHNNHTSSHGHGHEELSHHSHQQSHPLTSHQMHHSLSQVPHNLDHTVNVGVHDVNVDHHHSVHSSHENVDGGPETASAEDLAMANAIVGKADVDDENVAATLKAAAEQHV